jgi:hypothetical protein
MGINIAPDMIVNHPGIIKKITTKNTHINLIPVLTNGIVHIAGMSMYTTSMFMYTMNVLDIFTKKSILLTITDIVHMGLHTQEAVFISEPQYMNRGFPWPFR